MTHLRALEREKEGGMEGRRERGQSDRARERENWGQRKMGDSKEGRKGGKEEWEAKASGERSKGKRDRSRERGL